MDVKALKHALRHRKVTIGSWIQINHPVSAEILAQSGYDWLAADAEHTDIDPAGFANLARAIQDHKIAPFVRVRENNTLAIRQMLDMGAQGVIVPLVNNAREAEKAVRASKYPPRGIRGFAFSRMNQWGADFDAYARKANAETLVVVMIESREGVENIDSILAVNGVDGVFIGPYDLSGSFGIPGKTGDARIKKACRQILAACRKANKAAGLHVVIPSEKAIRQAVADGFTFIALGTDTVFLQQAARDALTIARK